MSFTTSVVVFAHSAFHSLSLFLFSYQPAYGPVRPPTCWHLVEYEHRLLWTTVAAAMSK